MNGFVQINKNYFHPLNNKCYASDILCSVYSGLIVYYLYNTTLNFTSYIVIKYTIHIENFIFIFIYFKL